MNVVRLGFYWSEVDVRLGETKVPELLSVSQTAGVVPRATLTDRPVSSSDLSKYKVCEPGDLVLNRFNAYRGSLGVAPLTGIVSPDYLVLRPSAGTDARYLEFVLRSQPLRDAMTMSMGGIGGGDPDSSGFARIDVFSLHRTKVAQRMLPEQRAIADYLDRETAKIDALIEKQTVLIDRLRERRWAQIARCLNPPDESAWTRLPLRYAVRYQEGPGIGAADFRDEGVPLLRIRGVSTATASVAGCNFLDPGMVADRWARFQVKEGDLLISASASIGTIARVSTPDVVGAVPYTGIIRIKPGRMTEEFARWFFVSEQFVRQVELLRTGSTIQHYGPSHLDRVMVSLPEAEEQREVADHLDRETAKIDALIGKAERFIELARERRSALITAAVTGQIDVTEGAA